MQLTATLILTALCSLVGSVPASVKIDRLVNSMGSGTLSRKDVARARQLKSGRARNDSVPIEDRTFSFFIPIQLGCPPATCKPLAVWARDAAHGTLKDNVILDTGSSNTWVGAQTSHPYIPTRCSKLTGNAVEVSYGSGFFAGTEYNDTLALANALTVQAQSIGAAQFARGFGEADGILGLGPEDLTEGTLTGPNAPSTMPTVSQNLGLTTFSIFMAPINSTAGDKGTLNFGPDTCPDSTQCIEAPHFTPVTTRSPASHFWGIDLVISYGDETILASSTNGKPNSGVVDSGTTLVILATDAFNLYMAATGATLDPNVGLLKLPTANFAGMKDLCFATGASRFCLTPDAQVWPTSLNTLIGGDTSSIYLITANSEELSGTGLDYILGQMFHERFLVTYDLSQNAVGLAKTPFTASTTNCGSLCA
ncbi:Aspartic peptidase A1 [Mycena indigotica]|uniref:Aspartic peptidase A1 n=1 Tax=Mycena indigotica TaxID=2126181 RepID=A0A8H6SZE7_9AGAR|nr:Aspartic peptidase A1 [Mycena indigotica]KAF7307466.1 Aspartic peptidase A1 [Mycena indigotica]